MTVTSGGRTSRTTVLLWVIVALVTAAAIWGELGRPLAPPLTAPTADLGDHIDGDRLALAREFHGQLLKLRVLGAAVVAVVAALLASPWLRRRIQGRTRIWADRRAHRGRRPPGAPAAAVLAAGTWLVLDVAVLPIVHASWTRSVAVGLSVQTFPEVLRDRGVVLAVELALVAATTLLVVWQAQARRPGWVPATGLLLGTGGVLLILISPLLLEPLLLSFTPLEEGPLRSEISAMAAEALGEDLDDVLVADASRRTTGSNAYVSGLGSTRRVVLYDTLLRDAPDDDVLAIVAHELSHRANADIPRAALVSLAGPTLVLAVLERLMRRRLREPDGRVRIAWVPAVVAWGVVLALLADPVASWSSRRAEAAADAGAIALTGDGPAYADMMSGLASRNLSDPDPPRWAVILWYSHPPISERVTRGLTS